MRKQDTRGIPIYHELHRLVSQGIDQGVYYDDAMTEFVNVHSEDRSPEVFLGTFDLRGLTDEEARAASRIVYNRLRHMPRSTWAIMQQTGTHGDYLEPVISAGNGILGNTCSFYPGPKQIGVCTLPCTFTNVYRKMLGMEVYLVRHVVIEERRLAADLAARPLFTIGDTFRNVQWGAMRSFSSLIVTKIDTTTGKISLTGTKRGSRRRWECTAHAAELAQMVGKGKSPPYPAFVTSRVVTG